MSEFLDVIHELSDNLGLIVLVGTIITALIGKFKYHISLFHPLHEIRQRQENYEQRQENYKRTRGLMILKEEMAKDYVALGNSLLNIIQLDAAKAEFEKGRSLDPVNQDAYIGILKSEIFQPILNKEPTYYDIERTTKKIEILLKRDENDKHAYFFLGEINRNYDKTKALENFKKVISIEPKTDLDSLAYFGMAWIEATNNGNQGNEKACKYLETAEEKCKSNPVILNGLGYQYIIQKNYDLAIEKLTYLLEINPYVISAYWNIINAYRLANQFGNAHKYSIKLMNYIKNDNVFSLGPNCRSYFFMADDDGSGVYFKEIIEKRCYSYYTVALTCYLLISEEEGKKYLEEAKGLQHCDKTSAQKYLKYNINCLKKENPIIISKLTEFEKLIES